MNIPVLRAVSEKSFLYLWLGELFTQMAVNLFNFFLILYVFQQTHSNTAVSGIVLAFTIPTILFGTIAGVFVDRWNKKRVLIVTNILRAIAILILAIFVNNLVMVYFIAFTVTVITQFFIPAESPIIPLVVRRQYLLSANALFGMGIFASILISFILAGPLLSHFKAANTLLLLATSYMIGAGIISLIRLTYAKIDEDKLGRKNLNIIRDLRETVKLISRTKEISGSLLLLSLSQALILVIATLAPGYATDVLKIRIEDFSVLFVAPAAIGMVVGAIALVNISRHRSKDKIITMGIFISGLVILLLPYCSKVASRDFIQILNLYLPSFLEINVYHIMGIIAFLLGIGDAFVFVPANTILQEKSSEEMRGKLYGFINTFVGILSLLPVIIVGGLSDLIGVGSVITGLGILIVLFGLTRVFMK